MTDLRAPLRYRKAAHADMTFAWIFGVGLVLMALLGVEHYQAIQADKEARVRQEAWELQERQNAFLALQQEQARLRAEQLADTQLRIDRERSRSSKSYAPDPSPSIRSGQSVAERNALEAIEIMHGTRRLQREWDQSQYSDSAPDPIVVGDSRGREPGVCGSLRSERTGSEWSRYAAICGDID
ncbi:hypothetical protein [Solimonas sp. SE-A11]|uniref:hypothetical protein n=1 Tax=Solimonas sp. SE-A11 TaxID=3054954 RepID=UPI00259CEDD4|nr:hypothetical protein [Solimonas sp. SE-A11]MDM4772194.1 hypothetical protein [Solimonas sp. SE-A11]